MYKERIETLRLSGSADTKEGAFNKIFGQIKQVVARQTSDLVVRIEPVHMELVSATESIHKERLFGLFFPRTRAKYDITVDIQVRLGVVDVASIPFQKQAEQAARLGQVLSQK
ncbi:DUF4312 family protein [Brevibacillus ruminantium]|uniref:DUF4312 family protein n=1 Tax=Brevibacillus ruminantium TaxID=2950604 RepID=A0ABY4WE54_9BACL|nr:DUF4312 family protein [Brevibacillus ruminantium]USG64217.1 DUF4312 family protein [Brevibacillus ruminantium]